eukprot:6372010-Lingulodinium_polyedra.AAC.1
MNITDRALWPQRLPWAAKNVYDMPIVLWMSKAGEQRAPSEPRGVIVLATQSLWGAGAVCGVIAPAA